MHVPHINTVKASVKLQVVLGSIRNFDRSHSGWLEQNLETIESEMSSVQIGGGKEESITDHTAG